MMPPQRPAAFLDRDGTLIYDTHYLRDPALVKLIDGVPPALRALKNAGFALVVITNQSGIARGLLSEADYEAVRARLDEILAQEGITLDASLHCPHEPSVSGPCDCRKPGTQLYEQAIAALDLDASRSLFVGDRWRDVAPGLALGGTAVLVPSENTPPDDVEHARSEARIVGTLAAAAALVLNTREA
jgi:D-glycero-D-manno-heptose 1,7-bisphosphate phosphatase